jgi:AcrR family transcriptional regulator
VVIALVGSPSAAGRPMRADARRNYEQLVEQARIAFAESGVDASLDEIARRAGVASGTLYRHFPTRHDLVETVLGEQIAELVALGRRLLTATDEFEALGTWCRAALTHALTYRGLAAAAMSSALDREGDGESDGESDGGNDLVSAWHAEMFEVGGALLARAHDSGTATTDADPVDVLKLVGAIALATPDSPARAERLLTLVLTGLRHSTSRPIRHGGDDVS